MTNENFKAERWIKNGVFGQTLPNTCLAATYLKEPTARYAVRLEHAAEPESKKYGRWTLIDRSTSTQISSVTTTETRSSIAVTGHLYKPENVREQADCRPPQAVFVNRFIGTKQVTEEQLVHLESSNASIDASIDVAKVVASGSPLPLITAEVEHAFYDDKEERHIFHQEIYNDGWEAAMDDALKRDVASYGSKLLLMPARKLISLELTGDSRGCKWLSECAQIWLRG